MSCLREKLRGDTHLPGPVPTEPAAAKWPVPQGFAPVHYLRQALAIARLDDAAVTVASLDKMAMLYGASFWVLGQLLILAGSLWAGGGAFARLGWFAALLAVEFVILLDAILVLAQYGLCHLLARWWFGARGTYKGVPASVAAGLHCHLAGDSSVRGSGHRGLVEHRRDDDRLRRRGRHQPSEGFWAVCGHWPLLYCPNACPPRAGMRSQTRPAVSPRVLPVR